MAKQQVVKLSNGAVLIYQKQGAFNGSSFVVGFVGGAQLDGKYEGASHLLEHLLFRPAEEDMRKNIMTSIMANSIGQNAFTTEDYIAVSASATKDNLERAIENCVAMLKPKGFTEEQIKKEIQIVKHEIGLDVPEQGDIVDLFLDRLAGIETDLSQRDRVLGSVRTLNKITPNILTEYVRRYFNTDNLVISITSNSPIKDIVQICEDKIVSQFSPAERPEYIIDTPEPAYYEEKNLLMAIPNPMSSNVDVQLLLRTRNGESEDVDKEFAYDIVEQYANNVIGGYLWDALRVKKSLVYSYAQSSMELGSVKFKNFGAETNAKKLRATIKELCGVIKKLATEGVDQETFETVKKAITDRNNASLNKYRSATALSNFDDFMQGKEFVDYKKVTQYIEEMTCADFNAYLQDQYKARNISMLVTGDFQSHQLPNLIDVEEMVGNTAHSKDKHLLNVPRFEFTSYIPKEVIVAQEQAAANAELEKAQEEAVLEYLDSIPPMIGIDDEPVSLKSDDKDLIQ